MNREAFFFDNCTPEKPALFGICSMPERLDPGKPGVLICHAFSEERQKSYRNTFLFAQMLAREGFPSLRFDYGGTGDSQGGLADLTMETMVADAVCAARELRNRQGVNNIVVLGIRLGAAIAVAAANRLEDVEAMVLWNPIVEGKRYFRDLMRTEKIIRLGSPMPATGDLIIRPGYHELDGESISPQMAEELKSLDLSQQKTPAVSCLITGCASDKHEQDQVDLLARHLRESDREVECWSGEERDYWSSESMYDEFHPVKTFDKTLSFLRDLTN